jgi:hypothetical protein
VGSVSFSWCLGVDRETRRPVDGWTLRPVDPAFATITQPDRHDIVTIAG